jgi:hypothetical protein
MLSTEVSTTTKENTMAYMTDLEAKEIIEHLRDRAVSDTVTLKHRIATLKTEMEVDPWEGTAAQITRKEDRLVVRVLEAKALAIAATKF